jgi:hypothetical protein
MHKFAIMNKAKIFQKILVMVLLTSFCVIGYAQVDDCVSKMEKRILQLAKAKSNDDLVKRIAEAQILLEKLGTCPCFERNSTFLEKEKKRLEKMFNENFSGNAFNYTLAAGTYTGSFVNGKKNGKGKMNYNESEDYYKYYDGEWKNGKMNGKGILEDWDGTIYNGEFKNGFKEGNGKETRKNGEYYEGNWSMDFHEGYGKAKKIYQDSSFFEGGVDKTMREHGWGIKVYNFRNQESIKKYEGEFYNGLTMGWATITWSDGSIYRGKWNQFGPEDVGELNLNNCKDAAYISNCPGARYYSGHYEKFLKDGYGRCYDKNHRLIYEGNFKKDKPYGTSYPNFFPIEKSIDSSFKKYSSGEFYFGQLLNNFRNGYGTLIYKNKSTIESEWLKNKPYGWGEYINEEKNMKFEGEWNDFYPNGWGRLMIKEKGEYIIVYEGQFKSQNISDKIEFIRNGFGFSFTNLGLEFNCCVNSMIHVGNWKNGKIDGFGRMYDESLHLLYEGQFKDDRPIGDKFPNR